jgi:hypothetical protein
MPERHTGNRNAKLGSIGEVRQTLLSGRVLLAEDHFALRAVQRLPRALPALQRAAQIIGEPGAASRAAG